MKIILVGANGDIGRIACAALGARHDIITVGRSSGDITVDISDLSAVRDMYAHAGPVDAVVCCAGEVTFAPLDTFTQDSFVLGLHQKVMGQVNLVLAGQDVLPDGGAFTLTSGVLDRDPIRSGTGAATANAALAGFVTGASIELVRGLRINVVSPGLLEVSKNRYGAWFPGHRPVASDDVARAYI